ncbi:magnesium chelatase domain-containing protein [Lentibacillus jeotgali]|uniref:magnesium chelatase domain-containing protein n=1 Tax=Lentibacillus jeotgali TaxID=558169 RepID=UPI0002627038
MPRVEGVNIVGLPDTSVKESKNRVIAALYANDCEVPDKKVVINLSPAEQKKNSPIFDLAMAIGIMILRRQFRIMLLFWVFYHWMARLNPLMACFRQSLLPNKKASSTCICHQ